MSQDNVNEAFILDTEVDNPFDRDEIASEIHKKNLDPTLIKPATNLVPNWRRLFKTLGQMEQGDIKFLIEGIMPEGVIFTGALAGGYKTWLALSMAKAVSTGQAFLGKYNVPERTHVLYLIPEAGERAFRRRMEKMGIEDNEFFLVRTMKDGKISLTDKLLIEAIGDLKPLVTLDTAVRFSDAESENSSNENNKGLANGIFGLLRAGAVTVHGVHHAPKAAANQVMTLENALRGTGDLGAMCDAVYALKCLDPITGLVEVKCVKPRDFEPVPAFQIQAKPYIDLDGDFRLLDTNLKIDDGARLLRAITANPNITYREITNTTGIPHKRIKDVAERLGYRKLGKQGELWVLDSEESGSN